MCFCPLLLGHILLLDYLINFIHRERFSTVGRQGREGKKKEKGKEIRRKGRREKEEGGEDIAESSGRPRNFRKGAAKVGKRISCTVVPVSLIYIVEALILLKLLGQVVT